MATPPGYVPSTPTVTFAGDGGHVSVSSTSLTLTAPTGVADTDCLIACIALGSSSGIATITPPIGWTLVDSVGYEAIAYTYDQGVAVYEKDWVLAVDSGANFVWTFSISSALDGSIKHLTSDMGRPSAHLSSNFGLSNGSYGQNDVIGALTADRGGEVAIVVVSSILAAGSWFWTPPTGMTSI